MPLIRHLEDSLEIAAKLWDDWLPTTVRSLIGASLPGGEADGRLLVSWMAGAHDVGKATVAFSWQVPALTQPMRIAGLDFPAVVVERDRRTLPHALAGHYLLRRWLTDDQGWSTASAKSFTTIVGSHHGVPPTPGQDFEAAEGRPWLIGSGSWTAVQNELIEHVTELSGALGRLPEWQRVVLPKPVQSLVTAVVILADWLASDDSRFPYQDDLTTQDRATRAWAHLALPTAWQPRDTPSDDSRLFSRRFRLPAGSSLRPVQVATLRIARAAKAPLLIVVEAQMGVGKTEAALGAAEILAGKFGSGGVFIALPTMATSDAMFERVHRWVQCLPVHADSPEQTMFLAHGRARLNETYGGLARDWSPRSVGDDGCESRHPGSETDLSASVVAHSWLSGRKKGPLANFVVGTIDQVLFSALKSRHLMLRHLALANKVVIIDEVHAADDFMRVYLARALHWLGAYGVPTILLSATLPSQQRRDLVAAYDEGRRAATSPRPPRQDPQMYDVLNGDISYPAVISSTGHTPQITTVDDDGQSISIRMEQIADDDETLIRVLSPLLKENGCVAVVRNTVRRAQAAAELLSRYFGEESVELLHSRFIATDRQSKERALVETLGPQNVVSAANKARPLRRIVVGTQVIEQSLDVDFDLLITDLAPIDLILQRIGRLHRHTRAGAEQRPQWVRQPRCLIAGVKDWASQPPKADTGSIVVYGEHVLLRSASSLLDVWNRGEIALPADIAPLVQHSYDPSHASPPGWEAAMSAAALKAMHDKAKRTVAAGVFLLGEVGPVGDSLEGWLDASVGEIDDDSPASQAQVRDGEDTIEAVVVQATSDGVRVLDWVPRESGRLIETHGASAPDPRVARAVAACSIRLPAFLSRGATGDKVIRALEDNFYPSWQQSPWLCGQLILELDESLSANIAGHRLHYDRRQGLLITPIEES